MHLFGVEHHALGLLLVLIDTHGSLESHLDLAIVYLLLVLLSRTHVIHSKVNIGFLHPLALKLLQSWLLVVVNSENWVTFSSFSLMLHAFD